MARNTEDEESRVLFPRRYNFHLSTSSVNVQTVFVSISESDSTKCCLFFHLFVPSKVIDDSPNLIMFSYTVGLKVIALFWKFAVFIYFYFFLSFLCSVCLLLLLPYYPVPLRKSLV